MCSSDLIDNGLGGEFAEPMPALAEYARGQLRTSPVLLNWDNAQCLLGQFHETAAYRGWVIDAVAVLVNHVHLACGVPGDPDPAKMLGDWKSYGSRALNRQCGRKTEWWAVGGSKRPLKSAERRWAANRYVRDQEKPLLVYLSAEASALLTQPP